MLWICVTVVAVAAIIAAIVIHKRRKKEKEMPAGIQIFNENGQLIFDLANKTTYVLGTGSTGTSNGSISNAKITARTWVIVLSCPSDGVMPYFSATQGNLSWQYLGGQMAPAPKNVTFMYGIY